MALPLEKKRQSVVQSKERRPRALETGAKTMENFNPEKEFSIK